MNEKYLWMCLIKMFHCFFYKKKPSNVYALISRSTSPYCLAIFFESVIEWRKVKWVEHFPKWWLSDWLIALQLFIFYPFPLLKLKKWIFPPLKKIKFPFLILRITTLIILLVRRKFTSHVKRCETTFFCWTSLKSWNEENIFFRFNQQTHLHLDRQTRMAQN